MRTALSTMIILTLLLAACGTSNLEKANGNWVCNVDATVAAMPEIAEGGPLADTMARKMFESISMNVDVKAKKLSLALGSMAQQDNSFTVVSDNGTVLVLATDADKVTMEFTGDDALVMYGESEKDKKIHFVRKKQ